MTHIIKKNISYLSLSIIRVVLGLLLAILLSIWIDYLLQTSMHLDTSIFDKEIIFYESIIYEHIILVVLFLFIWSVTGKYLLSLLMFIGIGLLTVYANSQKIEQRNEPIYPSELRELFNLKELWGLINPTELIKGIIWFALFSILLTFFYRKVSPFIDFKLVKFYKIDSNPTFYKKRRLITIYTRGSVALVTGVFLLLSLNFNRTDAIKHVIHFDDEKAADYGFNPSIIYRRHGFISGFLYYTGADFMSHDFAYSKQDMESIRLKYEKVAQGINQKRKHDFQDQKVVYILSESFSDPSKIQFLGVDNSPIPKINELKKDTMSGTMLSRSIGGGTANMEYSSLTSLNLALFSPQITVPYTSVIPSQKNTVHSVLDLYSEHTAYTIHPYTPNLYRRTDVLKKLGFKAIISEDNMQETNLIGNSNFYSDESAYNEALYTFDTKEKTNFIQIITMQNHGPNYQEFDNREVATVNSDSISDDMKTTVNNYMKGLNITDDATIDFLEKLDGYDENVTVLFYGDHLPYYYLSIGKELDNSQLLETEFFVYNSKMKNSHINYDSLSPLFFTNIVAKSNNSKISPFYALLEQLLNEGVTSFDQKNCVKDGKSIPIDDLDTQTKELITDFELIQYDQTTGKDFLGDTFYHIKK